MHCLVVRGPAGTIVRRWSADTRLNGRTFDEAALQPGDRLTLGPVELEIIDPGRVLAEPVAQRRSGDVAADHRTFRRGSSQKVHRGEATARRQRRRRMRRLIAAIRTARTERDTLRDDCTAQQYGLDELRYRCDRTSEYSTGLPNFSVKSGNISWATRGSTGVVAAWSK